MNNNFTGDELFRNADMPLDFNLLDFWGWYASDLLNHSVRGAIAEFVVGKALGTGNPKAGWSSCDIKYRSKRIEVKSCASLGAKSGKPTSRIVFNVKKQLCCKPEDIEEGYCSEADLWKTSCRHSDIYIFCHFKEQDASIANPLQLEQWEFFILPTKVLDDSIGDKQTIRIPQILELGGMRCSWDQLKQRVDALVS